MIPALVRLVVLAAALAVGVHAAPQTPAPLPPPDLNAAIDSLGAFDLAARTNAARVVRRAAPAAAVPALIRAGKSHKDTYVRYKSLVLLSAFDDPSVAETMRSLITDRDDRVRIVATSWFEFHPDRAALAGLIVALENEKSEYARPALTRAIAAHGDDPRVRAALLPFVTRGEDTFRGATIEALGDYRARFALEAIAGVAKLDGPLQEDAILSIGKIGDQAGLNTLSALQKDGPKERQAAIAAAVCLMGLQCDAQLGYLSKALTFVAGRIAAAARTSAGPTPEDEAELRATSRALGVLAASGRAPALTPLFDAGVSSKDPDRVAFALAIGEAAMRRPSSMLDALELRTDRDGAILLLRDAFDLLSQEDVGQERFFSAVRSAAQSPGLSPARRALAEALIRGLEI